LIFSTNEVLDVRLADRVIVLGKESKELWVNKGIAPSKIDTVPFGIDLKIYGPVKKDRELMNESGLADNDRVVLYVGHLDATRNPAPAVKAFSILLKKPAKAALRECLRLLVVGSGPLEKSLKEMVAELKLEEHVRFLPHTHDEMKLNKIYSLGELVILPNPPGTIAIQATACCLPVITIQNKSGFLGAIDERLLANFILLDSADPEKIAESCYDLLNSPEKLRDISNKGKEMISDYSWENVSRQLSNLLIGTAPGKS
jgi:glycosyltransferase involved in cell wall biosynthesis